QPDDERIANPLLPVRRVVEPDSMRRLHACKRIDRQTVEPDSVVAADVGDHRQSGWNFRCVDIYTACDDEEGDVAAARSQQLYEENFGRVWAFVRRRVHDRAAAQDITSEVFHQALANVTKFEWRGVPFAAWLYRIAANAIADHFARSAREQSAQAEESVPPHE